MTACSILRPSVLLSFVWVPLLPLFGLTLSTFLPSPETWLRLYRRSFISWSDWVIRLLHLYSRSDRRYVLVKGSVIQVLLWFVTVILVNKFIIPSLLLSPNPFGPEDTIYTYQSNPLVSQELPNIWNSGRKPPDNWKRCKITCCYTGSN